MDLSEVMAEDSAKPVKDVDTKLGLLSNISRRMSLAVTEIENLERLLKDKKKDFDHVQYVELPEAMQDLGMDKIVLSDGSSISISTEYYANISKAKANEAYSWLKENGFGDLIKNEINMKFARGEENTASHMRHVLEAYDVPYSEKESVHWQTLRAFVKEQIEAGAPIPMDTFSVHISNKATVKKGD